ncbi:hypothetical protein L1049_000899 [Liquidambar formosana]|uniref:Uncharacterized protein n=1 Tax=Liquidambar formosana TaxID=63359 RepID=A0AAP0R547_LIQFO
MASPFQEFVLTSSPDGPIIAYDASSGATLAYFTGSRSPRRGLTLTGKSLIAASHISSTSASGSIHLYNWWSSTAYHQLPLPEPVAPLAATPDGMYLFAGGLFGNIHTLALPSGNLLKSFMAHSKPVSCLEIIDDGSILISGGDDGTIVVSTVFKLLTASSNENANDFILHRIVAHAASVTAIKTSMGGCNSIIISCSLDCKCKFWSLLQGTPLRTVTFPCAIWGVAMDPLESEFYAAGSDGFVYSGALKVVSRQLVSRGYNELVTWAQRHCGAVISVAVVHEGRHLISASEDGGVWVWEVESRRVINALGNEIVGISDLVVAKRIGDGRGHAGGRFGSGTNESGCSSFGFSGRELSSPVRGITEMGGMLSVVGKDRSRAIDMLESAIGMYERLLELILKEAKGGTSSKQSNEQDKD